MEECNGEFWFDGCIPPTARQAKRAPHPRAHVQRGLITDHLAVRDDVRFLKQLGVLLEQTPPYAGPRGA
ncbi:MAG: hypothetical protein QOH48_977 [Actinomycetota bacterium]|jgi:hypothetical protein|nr:hypothetical protein [Actinomycetota bacterium]